MTDDRTSETTKGREGRTRGTETSLEKVDPALKNEGKTCSCALESVRESGSRLTCEITLKSQENISEEEADQESLILGLAERKNETKASVSMVSYLSLTP